MANGLSTAMTDRMRGLKDITGKEHTWVRADSDAFVFNESAILNADFNICYDFELHWY